MSSPILSIPSVDAETNARLFEVALARLRPALRTDPGLAESAPLDAVLETLDDERLAAIQVLARACEAYALRPALGERAFVLDGLPGARTVRFLPVFRTLSYRALWQRTVDLATGLVRCPETGLRPGATVGICGFGSIDQVVAHLACLYAGAVSLMLQPDLAAGELRHLVQEAGLACVICAVEHLPAVLAELAACPTVRSVVAMDLRGETGLARARAATALPLLTVAELARQGRAGARPGPGEPVPLDPFLPEPGTDPLATLLCTSGSTGCPKCAMFPQRLWRSHWHTGPLAPFRRFPSIGLSFYPLSHTLGLHSLLRTLVLGGVTHFTLASDLSTLFEDIRQVRPTFLILVPRIAQMVHQAFRAASQGPGFLGDRLTALLIGSAPTPPELAAFLAEQFQVPVFEAYGSTEAGLYTLDGIVCRPQVLDYRLEAAPELGYRLDDQPYPRGELLVRTRQCVPGYFHAPEATQRLFDPSGFLRTGDIVEDRGPDRLRWVDRRSNVLKLAQGEFITLWRLESLFSQASPCLEQVYLYADSRYAYPLAVLVPHRPALAARLRAAGLPDTPDAVRQVLRQELGRVAGEARLRSFEVPRDFLVESVPWTRENGLLTGIGKPARTRLQARYGERLAERYRQLEARQQAVLAPAGADPGLTLAERVRRAAASVLGAPDLDLAAGSFRALGGDSVGALSLALLLEEACGLPVPAAAILDPGRPLAALVPELQARLDRETSLERGARPSQPGPAAPAGAADRPGLAELPDFAALHGPTPAVLAAEAMSLDRWLGAADLAEARMVAARPLAPVRTVLLTGASGFLGHLLCLAWMERMARVGGRVLALVRAMDAAAAAARLREAFADHPPLALRFAALAPDHLVALPGDLAAPGLGLPAGGYDRLAAEVDLIVHAGALVNHAYRYEQLFAPNVQGTAQLVRLALRDRRKRFDFVSSLGVLAGARDPGRTLETEGVEALHPVWPAEGGYAHGYAASKWAGELLLRELHARFRAPVRVFRCGLILPHRHARGQFNAPDLLSRLLTSVLATGLAPHSFYAAGGHPHFDGLPVDFVAAALVALSSADRTGGATYQVSNPHRRDRVSLDTFMDWVASAGYPLERIADHATWLSAFRDRLQALPAPLRQRSALPILELWARPIPAGPEARVDGRRFGRAVALRRPGGEPGIPHLDEAYLHRYLADLAARAGIGPVSPASPVSAVSAVSPWPAGSSR